MKKRLLSLLLAIVMVIGILPAQAFAAEQIPLTETEPSEELRDSGKFYLATATAELSEAEAGWYLLRVVRTSPPTTAGITRCPFPTAACSIRG